MSSTRSTVRRTSPSPASSSDLDPVVGGDPAGDGLEERGRLLVHLLEHEMLVAALLGGLGRPVDGADRPLDAASPATSVIVTPHGRRSATSPSSRKMTRSVWARIAATSLARKLSPSPTPTTSGHVHPGADEPVRLGPVHDRQGVGAADPAQGGPDGVGEVAGVGLLDEVGDRLGVGLRGEDVAARLEPVAELAEVLDDPVVDDGDVAGAVLVGMGVEVVRPAVGRPAGVGQADRGVRRPIGDRGLEVGQLAGLLLDEQVAGVVDEGDPGRVVAAVLEPLEPLDEDGPRFARPGVADDPTHAFRVS